MFKSFQPPSELYYELDFIILNAINVCNKSVPRNMNTYMNKFVNDLLRY